MVNLGGKSQLTGKHEVNPVVNLGGKSGKHEVNPMVNLGGKSGKHEVNPEVVLQMPI